MSMLSLHRPTVTMLSKHWTVTRHSVYLARSIVLFKSNNYVLKCELSNKSNYYEWLTTVKKNLQTMI